MKVNYEAIVSLFKTVGVEGSRLSGQHVKRAGTSAGSTFRTAFRIVVHDDARINPSLIYLRKRPQLTTAIFSALHTG